MLVRGERLEHRTLADGTREKSGGEWFRGDYIIEDCKRLVTFIKVLDAMLGGHSRKETPRVVAAWGLWTWLKTANSAVSAFKSV